jgi:hypothetical protein
MSECRPNATRVAWLLLITALLLPDPSSAGELLFEQTWDTLSRYDSTLTPFSNREVADDFDLSAEIERIVVGGTSVILDDGVWVRFFDGGTDQPGALQAEYFFAEGDPGFIVGDTEAARFDITLPVPFQATGHHYVSVQAVAPGAWHWWNGELHTVSGTLAYQREDGGPWTTVLDVSFSLYGTLLGPGQITSLGETTLPRSGFLEVFGSGLGSTGQVLVDGAPAVIGSWTDDRIAAYVPETAGPGVVQVQVVHEGGASNTLDLEVTLRQPGRELWHVRLDTFYSEVRPAVGPDGTIYVVDVHDRLYAVSPDGAVLWVVEEAGSKGVDVDARGVIYTGNEDWIRAFNPDGSERWAYQQEPRAFVLPDVAVGPDGNVYALGSDGLGIFSLTPEGALRWATPEAYSRPIVSYTEIVFGAGSDGRDQLYFSANDKTRAIRLEDGTEVFRLGAIGVPAVSPVDGTIHGPYFAYHPSGSLAWQFGEALNGTPTVGASGIHYAATSMISPRLFALDTSGGELWSAQLGDSVINADVDPTEARIVLAKHDILLDLSSPGAILGADTADGTTLWRFELPIQDPGVPNPWTGDLGFNQYIDSRAAFAADGSAAYLITAIFGGDATTPRAFLYAFDLADEPTGESLLRSVDIVLQGRSRGGVVSIRGRVLIEDETGASVAGATVSATWTLPGGSTVSRTAITDSRGWARFQVRDEGGVFALTIDDVTKEGYVFDADNSVLSESIELF